MNILEAVLKYGDHTKECASRDYNENQWGGFHSYKGLPCDCGWDRTKQAVEKISAVVEED